MCFLFFFQAEDGIRYLVRSRGLGDVYKRQALGRHVHPKAPHVRHGVFDFVGQAKGPRFNVARVHPLVEQVDGLALSLIHI